MQIDDRYYEERRRVVDDVVTGYSQLVERRVAEGWTPYLATLTFDHIPGKPPRVTTQMLDAAERFYSRLVTRVVRRPRFSNELPILIVAPDLPVGKSDKPLREVGVNDGLHLHGLLLLPPRSRLRMSVEEHVRACQSFYCSPGADNQTRLRAIDLRPLAGDTGPAVAYALKSVARRRFSPDDVLVLPRSNSELRRRTEPIRACRDRPHPTDRRPQGR